MSPRNGWDDEGDEGPAIPPEQRSGSPASLAELPARVEIARWQWRKVARRKYRFVVVALGPVGRYVAGESPTFRGSTVSEHFDNSSFTAIRDDSEARDAFNALVRQLWDDGWEPTAFGRAWHDATYRRFVPHQVPADLAPAALEPASPPAPRPTVSGP